MWKWIVNHNVWNKVVAAGIISALGFLIIFIYGLFTEVPFLELFKKMVFYKISFWIIFLCFFLLIILIALYNKNNSKVLTPKKSHLEINQKAFIENRTKLINEEQNLIYRFRTYFHSVSALPIIKKLQIYCNAHTIPLELYKGRCPDANCPNNKIFYNFQATQNGIESQLVHEWDEMIGK